MMSTRARSRIFTPPPLLNSIARGVLQTPVLERLAGRSTALITFVGRNSGRFYTTPVTYTRRRNKVIITCDESRQWWRNLASHPGVRLRLAGSTYTGKARVLRGGDALADLISFYEDRPIAARMLGLKRNRSGRIAAVEVEALTGHTLAVVVDLTSNGLPAAAPVRRLRRAAPTVQMSISRLEV